MSWEKELGVSKSAAVRAGQAIMDIYNRGNEILVEYKEDQSPLTEADKKANQIITRVLCQNFPEYGILSEEETDNKKRLEQEFCFIVDPLDGTKEFIKRNGQFTVNIALAKNHEVVAGVVYAPVLGALYYASEGQGAFLEIDGKRRKLHVSDRVEDIRAVMSSSHCCQEMEELIHKYHLKNLIRMGSSLKGCLVAQGDAEIYYRHNFTMEWDTAAMQCIAEEAGAIFRQMDGSRMFYNRKDCVNRKGFYIINCEKNQLAAERES